MSSGTPADSYCYRLERGDVTLGHLRRTGGDFPWHHASFTPTEAFEEVRHLFEEVQRLGRIATECEQLGDDEGWDRVTDEKERVLDVIKKLGLWLVDADGSGPVGCNVIYIDGDRAWFR